MEEDDDDIYGTGEAADVEDDLKTSRTDTMNEDAEDEDEESESDIEIVTEQDKSVIQEPIKPPARNPITITRPDSTTPATTNAGRASPAIKSARSVTPPPSKPGSSYPALKTSTLDLDAKPIYEPSGKPITDVDIDTDIPGDDKPWRVPGSDQTDYFNYGFDEFTWAAYCMKQQELRTEAKEQKKAMGEFQNMFGGSSAGASTATSGMMPGFPGDMTPDMQAAMQAMMSSGMDPSQMDMNSFMQMMGGGGGGYGVPAMGGFDGYGGQQQQQQQPLSQQPQGHGGRGGRRGRGRW